MASTHFINALNDLLNPMTQTLAQKYIQSSHNTALVTFFLSKRHGIPWAGPKYLQFLSSGMGA
jgi:hypothetical protein